MVLVKFDKEKKKWIELPPGQKEEGSIYYDGYLLKKLKSVKDMMNKEWDVGILIDGIEGVGKSTLSFLCGWYISDASLTLFNICEGTADAVNKLEKLPDGSVLIIDEGSLMFSSKEVMRNEQRQLIKILNVIRQKRMCLIIVSPSFFELNKYIAVHRTRFLLHCYTDKKMTRGRFCYFGEREKHKLYQFGKKHFNSYSRPAANFYGRFNKFDPFGEAYQRLKRKSLLEAMKGKNKESPDYLKGLANGKIEASVMIAKSLPIETKEKLAKVLEIHRTTLYKRLKPKEMVVEGRL